MRSLLIRIVAALAGGALLALLVLPLAAVVLRVPPAALVERLGEREILEALRLSLIASLAAAAVVVAGGLPIAWLLASRSFRGKRALEVLIDLPMVLPPTVAGFALLMAFGRTGIVGAALARLGISIPFTTVAVVIAQAFMSAPFFVNAARAGFAAVDPRYVETAATLRASELERFVRVVLPLSAPALLAGIAMTWARALGEFGATITFAGNLPGVTETLPLAVYVAMQSDLQAALVLSTLLLAASCTLLFAVRLRPGLWLSRDARSRAA